MSVDIIYWDDENEKKQDWKGSKSSDVSCIKFETSFQNPGFAGVLVVKYLPAKARDTRDMGISGI